MSENPFQRQLDLKKEPVEKVQSPYLRLYGLHENPFPGLALFSPSALDPRRNGEIFDEQFRLAEEEAFCNKFVQPKTGNQPLSIGFIRLDPQAGGRGNGKSIFLHHLKQRLNLREWETEWLADPASPGLFVLGLHLLPEPKERKRFWQLILLIFETLANEQNLKDLDVQARSAILLGLLQPEQINDLAACDPEEITKALYPEEQFDEFLADFGLTLQAIQEEAERLLRQIGNHLLNEFFIKEYIEAGCSLYHLLAEKWNRNGFYDRVYHWRRDGVSWFVNGLIPILMLAGYRRLYLLLDEFEKIYVYQNSREREEFLDAMRQHFFERESVAVRYQFITLIVTVHPSIDRYLSDHWRRVGLDNLAPLDPDRILEQSVELGASTIDKLRHLLITYMDFFRLDEGGANHRETEYPFEPGALEPAMEAARFYPRGTLWYAHHILNKAASEEVPPLITRKYVEEFVASGRKPSVDEDDELFKLPSSLSDLQA